MTQELIPGTTTKNGLVANSDLMYEPPAQEDDWSIRDAGEAFIKSLTSGSKFQHPADTAAGEETWNDPDFGQEPVEDEPEAEEEPLDEVAPIEGEQAEVEEQEEEEDPKLARGIQRVVQRELAAKAREDAAAAREARAEARLAELKRYEGLKPTAELSEQFDIDPLGAIKALGKDPDTVVKLVLAQHLGDSAPDAIKEFARGASEKREIAKIRAELAQERQQRAAQEYFNTISGGAREYVTKNVGDVKAQKSLPTLTRAASVDPDYVHGEIMEEIVKEAQSRAARDPDGEPISYDEAAKRVETRLARLAKLFTVPSTTNGAKIGQKPRTAPPTAKPAAKPLAPWQRRTSNIEEDGIAQALRVYEAEEAKRKQRR